MPGKTKQAFPRLAPRRSLRGEYIRKALDLRSSEAAADLVRGWDASGEIGVVKPEIPTVREAVGHFLDDAKAQHLSHETIRKYENLFEKRFLPTAKTGTPVAKQVANEEHRHDKQGAADEGRHEVPDHEIQLQELE